ncbi:MAG: hypothetical protein ABI406_04485 [Ktedonobacteraceae bacterium]
MVHQRKLRFGAALMIIGSLLAAWGEVVNAQTTDVLSSSWRLSLGFIVCGNFVLLVGISIFAFVSESVSGPGFVGSILLQLGEFLLIIGTVVLDWIILPFFINLANTLASAINEPATKTQNALNKVIASLNGLGGPVLQRLVPGLNTHIPLAHVPLVNGTQLVNNALAELHLPTIDTLRWWGHFSLSGGPLIPGCVILGLVLLLRRSNLALTGCLLIIFSLLNLLSQWLTSLPLWLDNGTAVLLFLTLAWLGVSAWLWEGRYSAHAAGGERHEFVE